MLSRPGIIMWRRHPWGKGVEVWVAPTAAVVILRTRSGYPYKSGLVCGQPELLVTDKQKVADLVWELKNVKKKIHSECPGLALHAEGAGVRDQWPNITEFMTTALYDDGEKREAPTVTFWCAAGQWKAVLKDRAEGLCMWLSAPTCLELLQMIELMALEPSGPWRHDEVDHERNGKRVKKHVDTSKG